jgi:serine/threonine protein kinase
LNTEKRENRVLNEIKLMEMINSPNVIRIKDWLKTTTKYYIALEFCNGGDLNNLRKAVGGYF